MTTSELLNVNLDQIIGILRGYRVPHSKEAELQDGLEAIFQAVGLRFVREKRLSRESRIDFWFPAGVQGFGLEVKTAGSQQDVLRQLHRYAEHPVICGLVLVTTKRKHIYQPSLQLNGKPTRMVWINNMGLVY